MKIIITLCILFIALPVYAGTWKDDFENEKDFVKDRDEGVWIEDISFYKWEKGVIKGTGQVNGADIITGDYAWEDYTVECRISPLVISNYVGLIFRRTCTWCLPCYIFGLSNGNAVIYRDWFTLLDSSHFNVEMETWYSLKVIASGKRLEFYVNNKLITKVEDSTYPAGKAGFVIYPDGMALFDDFIMTGPEVKDGGHWNPKAHAQIAVKPQEKLSGTWGQIKGN